MTVRDHDGAKELHVLVPPQFLAALQERQRDLAEAQRLAQVGSWSWDLTTGVVTWSDELYRILGVAPAERAPSVQAFLSLVDPIDRSMVERAFEVARSSLAPVSIDHRLTSGGGERWVRSLGQVDVAADGSPVRLHGTAQDVTQAVVTRRAMDELNRRLDAIAQSRPSGDATIDDGDSRVQDPAHRSCGHAEPAAVALDPLTGLANHGMLREFAAQALARATRHGWVTAVMVIDIDHFSDINEDYGHEVGDEVLVHVAARLSSTFRASDIVAREGHHRVAGAIGAVARLGGDRFVVVCENAVDAGVAASLAARVARVLEEPLPIVGTDDISVTAGVGVGISGPAGPNLEQRILDAEAALAQAKQRGRRQCEVVAEGMATGRHRHLEAERALRRAIDRGELRLHYQPKVSFESGQITGAEALLRWEDPERGLVPPLDFIPLAEETGLIIPIGTWVIEQGCRQAAEWNHRFPRLPPLVIAVNVSGRQFGPMLIDAVAQALASSGARPEQLCLEVTESILMGDSDAAIATLSELSALGVKLSMDDFGTGYSSLSYLQRFPLHELKIDKFFIKGVADGGRETAIVAATVAMAHALGLAVVAEGVERPEQFERLRVFGCQEAQGYFISRPQPAEAVAQLLAKEAGGPWRLAAAALQSPAAELHRAEQILVVDDAGDVRQLASMTLATAGFEVHEASCGGDAITAARQIRPDCVLLDVTMPDMSGFTVCRALRADPATAGCTIVMLTSNASRDDKVEAFSCGADDYIVKPFSPRDLVGRIRAAVGHRADAQRRSHQLAAKSPRSRA